MKPVRLPKRTARPGRPSGTFTQFRRLEALRELLEAQPSGATVEELAAVLRVTPRSVRRYLAEVKDEIGLESVEPIRGGPHRWRLSPGERPRSVAVRRAQAYWLYAARRAFDPLAGSAIHDEVTLALQALAQLAVRPQRSSQGLAVREGSRFEERLAIAAPLARTQGARGADIDDLFRATAELREVVVRLREAGDERGERRVLQPLAIVVESGEVRCLARDYDSRAMRVFSTDHVESVELRPVHFALPDGFDLANHTHPLCGLLAAPDARTATLEFDAADARAIRGRKLHPKQRLATSSDGRVRVVFPLGDVAALARWILSHGIPARAVGPEDLVAAVREAAARVQARH